jgi:hypothetical protein
VTYTVTHPDRNTTTVRIVDTRGTWVNTVTIPGRIPDRVAIDQAREATGYHG